jgi:hypothetical protein
MLGAEGVSKGETRAQAVRVSRVRTRQSFRVVCWGRRCGDKAIRELGRATACYPNEGSKRLKRGYRETSQFLAPWLLRRWRALAGVPLRAVLLKVTAARATPALSRLTPET